MAIIVNPASAAPSPAQLATPGGAKAWKAAREFEAVAIGQLLAPMFDSVDAANGMFGGGEGETAWRPMLTQEIAKDLSAHGGIGLAMPVFRQMLLLQEKTS